jgi:hypothetical protein
VGPTQEQIAAAHWDTLKPGLPLFRRLVKERVAEAMKGRGEIQSARWHQARYPGAAALFNGSQVEGYARRVMHFALFGGAVTASNSLPIVLPVLAVG